MSKVKYSSVLTAGFNCSSFFQGFAAFSGALTPIAAGNIGTNSFLQDAFMRDQSKIAQDFRTSFIAILSETNTTDSKQLSFDLLPE